MIAALCVLGAAATVAGWRVVRSGRGSVWLVMALVNGVIGLCALLTGRVSAATQVDPWVAAAVGAGAGVGLYVATTGFVLVVRRWPVFDRDVAGTYGLGGNISLPIALALVVAVYAPGEELFWRGLVQGELGSALSSASGAILAWLGYVAAESTSGSLAIAAAAVVAGGAWTGLASWSGGVLAGVVSHAIWTGAMLAMPPGGTGGRPLPDAAAGDTAGPASP